MEMNIGDLVWLDGYTSIAQQNSQEEFEIEKKEYRFDELTGDEFPIYFVNGIWFDGRDGGAYKNEDCMYYIEMRVVVDAVEETIDERTKRIIKKWEESELLSGLTAMDDANSPMIKLMESIKNQKVNEFPNIQPMQPIVKNELTEMEQVMLDKLEQGGPEMIQKYSAIWCYLDGKRNGCKTFDERVDQISNEIRTQKVTE